MASLADCVELAISAGRISRPDGQDLLRKAEAQTRRLELAGEVTPERALSEGQLDALAQAKLEVAIQRRQKALQAIAISKTTTRILNHPKSPAAGAAALLGRQLRNEAVGGSNVETRARAVVGQAHSIMAEAIAKLRTRWFGITQDKALLQDTVRAIFGSEASSAEAKAIAKAWGETAEMLRQRFNRAGGAIAKRADWGLPQAHDAARVGRVSKDEWISYVMPRLNRERMLSESGAQLTDPELDSLLSRVYETVKSDGLVDMVPGQQGGSKLANRHRDSRVLSFKDGDAWLEYQQRFGGADVFTTMTDHIERMAHETALLEILGPNPAATWRYATDVAQKHGAKGADLQYLDALYNVVSGNVNNRSNVWLADFMGATRNWITAARLGSALLSQISDIGFMRSTARWNGMAPTKVMARFVKMMAEGPEGEGRMLAARTGLTAELWITRALAANRWTDVVGAGYSAKAADFTMRASGMSMWNDSMKKAFQMELLAHVAESSRLAWDRLPKTLKRTLEAYDFTPDEWDLLRRAPTYDQGGARFASPEMILKWDEIPMDRRRQLATHLQELVFSESRFAVPESDARTRVLATAGQPRGTVGGEIMRGTAQFKSFPVSVLLLHISRGLNTGSVTDGAKYLAGLTIGTTLLGALAYQSKQVTRGKDPAPMDNPKFWAAAFVQGGGAGIYGDFLFSDVNRFGSGLVSTFIGPTANLVDDAAKLTLGNVQEFVRGEEMNLTSDIIRFAGSYAPGIQLWYSRLAFERHVIDQLEELAAPAATNRRFRRAQQRARKEHGQEFWWRQGERTPDRAPDLANALGD